MKALIAMSGGVDSSVAARLTLDMGYSCIGCMMKLYENNDRTHTRTCCSLNDAEDARNVAYKLDIPFYVFNFTREFRDIIIEKFVNSYQNGLTPNPCIDCNKYMKFDKLYERAVVLGCDYIVTGHYARIEKVNDKYILKKALDLTKDQSYVLYSMTQEHLAHTLFPLGELNKTDVRKIAEKNNFCNSFKPDSQDICFVPDGNYSEFIENYTGKIFEKGNFTDYNGNILGTHKGICRYTIGQRKGIGISAEKPYYVCKINPEDNTVTIGDKSKCLCREMYVKEFNWISGDIPEREIRCKVKVRYRAAEQPATVIPVNNTVARIIFDTPQMAVTPGQSAVLYDEDIVLGGGIINID